jgi:hypothetical protein
MQNILKENLTSGVVINEGQKSPEKVTNKLK